jgi:hypothetical protein
MKKVKIMHDEEFYEKQQLKNAVEVEGELEQCNFRLTYSLVNRIKRGIDSGNIEVTNDTSVKDDELFTSSSARWIHDSHLQCMLGELAKVTKFIPTEERRLLNDVEESRYQGAALALRWLLGHQDEELHDCLLSDRGVVKLELHETSDPTELDVNA